MRRSGIASGTLAHHVARLMRAGSVWRITFDTRLLHFPASHPRGPGPVRSAYEASHLNDLDRRLLDRLRVAPELQKALLDAFEDVPRSTVQHRLYYLTRLGYLTTTPRGRRLEYAAVREDSCGGGEAGCDGTSGRGRDAFQVAGGEEVSGVVGAV